MKILFFCRRFYPDIGGVEKHVLEISKILFKKGHQVTVITENLSSQKSRLKADQPLAEKVKSIYGIKIIRINAGKNNWFKKFRIWKNLWSLRKLIQESDVIHCHDVFFWYLPFRFLYPYKPTFTTFHGYEGFPIKKKALIVRKISELLSWGNICIGDFIKKWYGTKPTFVSYGAVDLHTVIPDLIRDPDGKMLDSRLRGNDNGKESAVFIGRLDDDTGILTYIKTFEILKKKFPKFEFLVIGDGKYKKQIEKKVKVLGFQKNPEKYLKKYHFAFVSGYLSILESFAAKKLVFALYNNAIKEDYLKMSPFSKWIIIEKTPEKIAQKVEYFFNNPEKEKKIVKDEFEWVKNQTWDNLLKIYLDLWRSTKT